MDAPAYDKLLETLDSAKLTLAAQIGNLSSADQRIRCLLNITTDEARRALREVKAVARVREANDSARSALAENGARAHSSQSGPAG